MNKFLLLLLLMFPSVVSAHAINTFHFHDGILSLIAAFMFVILTKQIMKRKNEKIN